MPKYYVSPRALAHIKAIGRYIARDNKAAAHRVIDAMYAEFSALAADPYIGKMRASKDPSLKDLRSWPVSNFRRYMIFYRVTPENMVQIIFVYDQSRDIATLIQE